MGAGGFLEKARAWLAGLSWAEQALGVMGISTIPWVELRGSIPLAIALGWDPLAAAAVAVAANCLIIVPGYYALELFYGRWLSRLEVARRLVARIRARGSSMVERYELLGLALFVALPLSRDGVMPAAIAVRNIPYVIIVTVLALAMGHGGGRPGRGGWGGPPMGGGWGGGGGFSSGGGGSFGGGGASGRW